MAPRAKPFVFEDAWLFAALCDPPAKTAAEHWGAIITRGDVLNRAILSFSEVERAVPKLFRHGLIAITGGRVVLTDHGRKVYENGLARRGGLFSIVSNMLAALNSNRIRHPTASQSPNLRTITPERYAEAIAMHERQSREVIRKLTSRS